MSKIDKSWNKKELILMIEVYKMDIEDYKHLTKKEVSDSILEFVEDVGPVIEWSDEFPDIITWDDLLDLLGNPKENTDLDYRQKQEIIQKAKIILNYSRQGYKVSYTKFKDFQELYDVAIIVAQHGDISTCRRAITEFNLDKKVRNKIDIKISPKTQKILQQKQINKDDLAPKLKIRHVPITLTFD
jgi:hypothetical protein|tara:strand:- start:20 stop:577 length:558 start_codon:yes stop_codon:yes gene_type:complete